MKPRSDSPRTIFQSVSSTHSMGMPAPQLSPGPSPRKKRVLPNPTSIFARIVVATGCFSGAFTGDTFGVGAGGVATAVGAFRRVAFVLLAAALEGEVPALFLAAAGAASVSDVAGVRNVVGLLVFFFITVVGLVDRKLSSEKEVTLANQWPMANPD